MTDPRNTPYRLSKVLDLRGPGEPPSIDQLKKRLEGMGAAPGLLATADGTLLKRLRSLRRQNVPFDLFAVVPNMTIYVRLVSQLGAPRAGLKIARDAGIQALIRTGWRVTRELRGIVKNDFCAIMRILVEFELSQILPLQAKGVFLHPQITDLALSFQNSRVLTDFNASVARLSQTTASGFGTNNLGLFYLRSGKWKLPSSPVLAPFNPNGFLMKPNRDRCETLARDPSCRILADRIRLAPAATNEALRYLEDFSGIAAAVVDA
ncbi:MAG: hypothetical protein WC859_05940 [Elusimicrobiota bacterium]|jgi:hypothetical protein